MIWSEILYVISHTMPYTILCVTNRIRHRIWYLIRFGTWDGLDSYLCLVQRLHSALRIQTFVACSVYPCLNFIWVSIRVDSGEGMYKLDIALCHTWSQLPPLRAVQYKHVKKGSAQTNAINCKTEVDIIWTQLVQVCNHMIHGTMVKIKPPVH
jgi:hypothetical protein